MDKKESSSKSLKSIRREGERGILGEGLTEYRFLITRL